MSDRLIQVYKERREKEIKRRVNFNDRVRRRRLLFEGEEYKKRYEERMSLNPNLDPE